MENLMIILTIELEVDEKDFDRQERAFNCDEFIPKSPKVIENIIQKIAMKNIRGFHAIEASEYSGSQSS